MTRTTPVHRALAAFAVAASATGAFAGGVSAAPSSQQPNLKNRYIVVLEPGARPGRAAERHAHRYGLRIGHVYRHALRGYSAVVPPGKLRELRQDARVDYVVHDMLVAGMAAPGQPSDRGAQARENGIAHLPENNLPPQASAMAEPQGLPFGGETPTPETQAEATPDASGEALVEGASAEDSVEGAGVGNDAVEGAGKAGGGGGGTTTSTQVLPTGINRIDADVSSQVSGNRSGAVSVGVAVLDTGSGPHPDLNVPGGVNCVPRTKGTTDLQGHGTHVAGIIGAKDDSAGVVGVAPGAPIWSVRVLGTSITGTTADLICGLDWLAANGPAKGIAVANLSLEMTRTGATADLDDDCDASIGEPLHDAICRVIAKGITVVAAGGNHTTDLVNTVPAAYNDVLAVNAIADFDGAPGGLGTAPNTCEADGDDTSAEFSNWAGDTGLDMLHTVAAPGRCLNSTWKGGGYNLQSGTSFAAPHVAGLVALCEQSGACAGLAPREIVTRIHDDASAAMGPFGFTDDPGSPLAGRWYGPLVSAAGY